MIEAITIFATQMALGTFVVIMVSGVIDWIARQF